MKRRFAWLGIVAAVTGAAAGGAIDAVTQVAASGQVDPESLKKTALTGAVVGVFAYFKRSPQETAPQAEMRDHVRDLDGGER